MTRVGSCCVPLVTAFVKVPLALMAVGLQVGARLFELGLFLLTLPLRLL